MSQHASPHPVSRNVGDDPESASTVEEVAELVREILDRPDLPADADIFDHGATSLSFVRILAQIRQRYGVSIDVTELDGEAAATTLAAQVAGSTSSTSQH